LVVATAPALVAGTAPALVVAEDLLHLVGSEVEELLELVGFDPDPPAAAFTVAHR
jgi:hypothetical protein